MDDLARFEAVTAECEELSEELDKLYVSRRDLAYKARHHGGKGAEIAAAMGVTPPWVFSNIAKPDTVDQRTSQVTKLLDNLTHLAVEIDSVKATLARLRSRRNELAITLNAAGVGRRYLATRVGVEVVTVNSWIGNDQRKQAEQS